MASFKGIYNMVPFKGIYNRVPLKGFIIGFYDVGGLNNQIIVVC